MSKKLQLKQKQIGNENRMENIEKCVTNPFEWMLTVLQLPNIHIPLRNFRTVHTCAYGYLKISRSLSYALSLLRVRKDNLFQRSGFVKFMNNQTN